MQAAIKDELREQIEGKEEVRRGVLKKEKP